MRRAEYEITVAANYAVAPQGRKRRLPSPLAALPEGLVGAGLLSGALGALGIPICRLDT